MNRTVLAAAFLLLFACATIPAVTPPAPKPAALAVLTQAVSPAATPAPTATATTGYQATITAAAGVAQTAQAGLDSQNRLFVEFTATQDARAFTLRSWTATADEYRRLAVAATAEAAPTFVPVTRTVEAAAFFARGTEDNLSMTQISATLSAPTMIVAIAQARAQASAAQATAWASVAGLITLSVLCVCFGVYLLTVTRKIWREEQKLASEQLEPQPMWKSSVRVSAPTLKDAEGLADMAERHFGTVVTLRSEDGATRYPVPATPKQLDALATGVLAKVPITFEAWAGKGKVFSRDEWVEMRNFLQRHALTHAVGAQGVLGLTGDGETFFRGWQERQRLPSGYVIMPEGFNPEKEYMHAREVHARAEAVGEARRG